MISLMKRLNCKSFAKLNLCLHVLNRRDDGFHNLQSIFETIDFYDSLIFEKSDTNKVIFNSNRDDLTEEGNLIISAYKILLENINLRMINITLEKIYLWVLDWVGEAQMLLLHCLLLIDYTI